VANIVSLLIFTTTLAVGQLLFKQVGLSLRGRPLVSGMLSITQEPAFYLALVLYGFATLLWIWILARVPLMQAYPWVAIGIALVPLLSWFVFDERVTPVFWLGIAFIMAGVLLTQLGASAR